MHAAWDGDVESVRLLIDAKSDLSIKNKDGETIVGKTSRRITPIPTYMDKDEVQRYRTILQMLRAAGAPE